MNTLPDVFSRLVEKDATILINHVMTLTCSWRSETSQVKAHHEWLCARNGVDRTLALMTQRHPEEMSARLWPQLRHDVRKYIQSCATCQKMEVRHKSRASLSTLKPMRALDTIGPMDISAEFRYLIVFTCPLGTNT